MQILSSKNSRIIARRRLATTWNSFHYKRTSDIFMFFTQQKKEIHQLRQNQDYPDRTPAAEMVNVLENGKPSLEHIALE